MGPRLFGDSREWACSRAHGQVLEVAVDSGMNLPFYPSEVTVTGIDLSDRMLDHIVSDAWAARLTEGR